MTRSSSGAYGAADDIVDYILGITYEIWEQGGVDLIERYYAADIPVYCLEGVVQGAAAVIAGTRATLASFADRRLLGDDVIWSGNRQEGYYSSHRVISPMTNNGPTAYGPATGRRVTIMNIADCFVEDGVITQEWLLRDNHALVMQLGLDPVQAARVIAARRDDASANWIADEVDRLGTVDQTVATGLPSPAADTAGFVTALLSAQWKSGRSATIEAGYAPYAVLHRSPVSLFGGRLAIASHYDELRNAIDVAALSVDHVAVQPWGSNGLHVAARWALCGSHAGNFLGHAGTGKPVYVLGATHWRIVANRVVVEWTVFDSVAALSQLIQV